MNQANHSPALPKIRIPILLLAALVLADCTPPAVTDSLYYNEPYRPQFHFSPEKNWMNDPNGLVYYDGEYHLFYQHNPFGPKWGHMSWGHAVSDDLVHWKHLPVALYEEDGVMIFSGSAVVDRKNTSGFGSNDAPPLVAIYTGHTPENQSQHIAYSNDRGRTWTKFDGNPVIDLNMKDFRDPKVFWHESSEKWIMAVSLSQERKVHFYGSENLKEWGFLSEFGPEGTPTGIWECPDLFELPIEGTDGESRWVLVMNIGSGAPAGGSGGQYFIGSFDGERFVNDNPDTLALWIDHGADHYAAVSWSDIPEQDGRRIIIGWMNNWHANDIPTSPWRSAQALPRSLSLRQTSDGIRLAQYPVRELKTLRGEPIPHSVSIVDGQITLDEVEEELFELESSFVLNGATSFGILLQHTPDQTTRIGVDVENSSLFVDRTQSGDDSFHEAFAAVHTAPVLIEDGKVILRLWVDRSSVEVFAQDGLAAITDRIFPEQGAPAVSLWAEGGAVEVESLSVWPLQPVW